MTAPTEALSRLHGGLRLTAHKVESTRASIREIGIPAQLVIPVGQHAGSAARPLVTPGETVKRGQLIAEATGPVSANIHASSSGRVVTIAERPVPVRGGGNASCIVIETDGYDTPHDSCEPLEPAVAGDSARLAAAIRGAGIVGLGGAAYPTAAKLADGGTRPLEGLILNGVECEPYISCDDMLMRERPAEILAGAELMLHVLGVSRCLLAIESDKREAWRAMRSALADTGSEAIRLVQIPTVYPSGGEDQLVKLLTGREVPSGGLPADTGYVVNNVATAAAIATFVATGEPLVSRVVTVTGDGIENPGNYRVRFGTAIADVVRAAGGYREGVRHLVMGGAMTGIPLMHDEVPVTKAANCLIFTGERPRSRAPRRPCIRCGECAAVCPVRLQPQQLHRHAQPPREAGLIEFGLGDCIECGCCDLVCPSHIPLTRQFREAKAAMRLRAHERRKAERARERYEAREARLRSSAEAETEALENRKAQASPDAIREILDRQRGGPSD